MDEITKEDIKMIEDVEKEVVEEYPEIKQELDKIEEEDGGYVLLNA